MRKTVAFMMLIVLLTALFTVCAASAEGFSVGDTVTFGSYPQGADGEVRPIEWTVLDIDEDGYYVLMSVYGLGAKPYNEQYTEVTWENCTLRAWLNGEFLNAAFTADEQAKMKTAHLVNEDNPVWKTVGGGDTDDMVYLLSLDEITEYYGISVEDYNKVHDVLSCAPTGYAGSNGAYTDESNGGGSWWLRSPGSAGNSAAAVYSDGSVRENGNGVPSASTAVRPVIRVKIN